MKRLKINVQWTDKVVDLIVVILGITIAFTLNNWNNERQADKLRKKYLNSLYNDLQKDSVNLASSFEGIIKEKRLADTIFSVLSNKNPEDAVHKASFFSRVGSTPGVFSSENFSYKALQQSGNIALLSDSLQIMLGELNDEYEKIGKQQEIFEEIIFTYAVPIYFNYDDIDKTVDNPELYYGARFKNVILGISGNISGRRSSIDKAKAKLNEVLLYVSENQGHK